MSMNLLINTNKNWRMLSALRIAGILIIISTLSCHDESISGVEDEPIVNYTFTTLDSVTGIPIAGVNIQLVTLLKDTIAKKTDSSYGTITFSDIQSSINLVTITKQGYRRIDTLLEINVEKDSVREEFDLPINQNYTFYLVNLNVSVHDSSSALIQSIPGQTIKPDEALVFTFNQRANKDEIKIEVSEVNSSYTLDTPWELSEDGKTINITLQDSGRWQEGITYRYTLSAKNDTGAVFHIAGDTSEVLIGYFSVIISDVEENKLKFPSNFRVAYWNSGTNPRFDSNHILTSPLPDSTSNLAQLKWQNPTVSSGEKLSDSIVIYIKDTRTFTNWTLWKTLSVKPDSFTLFLFDLYKTKAESSSKPIFPLLVGTDESFELQFKPKSMGKLFEEKIQFLDAPITQGMGDRVISKFTLPDTMLIKGGEVSKPIQASFVFEADSNQAFKMDTTDFEPIIEISGSSYDYQEGDLEWVWTSESSGQFTYSGSSNADLRFTIFRFDLKPNEYTNFHGNTSKAPIWMDKQRNFFEVPRE